MPSVDNDGKKECLERIKSADKKVCQSELKRACKDSKAREHRIDEREPARAHQNAVGGAEKEKSRHYWKRMRKGGAKGGQMLSFFCHKYRL